jgi:hypothetical protein
VRGYNEGRGGERRATGAVGLFVDVSARVYCIEQHYVRRSFTIPKWRMGTAKNEAGPLKESHETKDRPLSSNQSPVAHFASAVGRLPMPHFTIRLQTSPGKAVGETVNSLPPVRSPSEPWSSGDTVPPTWTVEVASLADVNKIIDKKLEELANRVAKLEARLKGSEEDSAQRADQAEHPKKTLHSDKGSDEKSESKNDSDRKVDAKKSAEEKPNEEKPHEDRHEANESSGSTVT